MAARRHFSLWWVGAAWILVFIVGANLHRWAIRNHEVAEALLIAYASIIYAAGTWWLAKWADRETERRRHLDSEQP